MEFHFKTNKSTKIIFGALPEFSNDENYAFIVDEKILELYPDLRAKLKKYPLIGFEAIEKNKNFESLNFLFNFFQKNKLNRSFNIVAIGGGVTTDYVALAASLFMRGCNLILVPTTLLAMVDASLGGKTAVHFNERKNAIGSFYPASKIFIDFGFLQTLPKNEIQNGWSEIIKTALISKNKLRDLILQKKSLEDVIKKTIQIKMDICERDIFDRGERRFLNFGHSFAHIIESYFNFNIPHGKAVAVGIRIAIFFAHRYLKINYDDEVKLLLNKLSDHEIDLSGLTIDILADLISSDKKNTNKINLVLLKGIGEPFIYSVENLEDVLFAMKNYE